MKSIDYVIKKTAEELNLTEDQVARVYMEYWRIVYKKLLTMESSTLFLRKIGLIAISKFKIHSYITKKIAMIRNMRKSNHPGSIKQSYEERHMGKLKKALKQRNILAHHYAKKFGNI